MIGKFASVFFWTVPFITMAISYGDYDEQLRDYYDNLYQRSSVKEQESEGKSSEILKLTMPGVHPTKVSGAFFNYPFYRLFFELFELISQGISFWKQLEFFIRCYS